MNVVTALLAFIVIMIVLSTVVAATVHIIHRLRSLRKRHIKVFIRAYFDQVIQPNFGAPGAIAAPPQGQAPVDVPPQEKSVLEWVYGAILRFQAALANRFPSAAGMRYFVVLGAVLAVAIWALAICFPALAAAALCVVGTMAFGLSAMRRDVTAAQTPEGQRREQFVQEMTSILSARPARSGTTESLSAVEFASRLARTEIGRVIAAKGEQKVAVILTDLVRRFDSLGAGSTESFRAMSRRWSIVVAFVVAIVANVDAIVIFRYFVDNPTAAERVAEMGAKATESFQATQRALEAEEKRAQEAADKALADKKKEAVGEMAAVRDLIRANNDAFKKQVEALSAIGVPVGWESFPYCVKDGGKISDRRCKPTLQPFDPAPEIMCSSGKSAWPTWLKPACAAAQFVAGNVKWFCERWKDKGAFLGWIVGVLVAGALIGLGGPFWFDLYNQLSVVAQMLRGLGMGARPKEPSRGAADDKEGQPPAPPKPETAHAPKSAVDAFNDAVKADQFLNVATPRSRRILAPDGSPLRH